MSSATVSPSFYADFQGLDRLRASAARQDPQALREAARQFEGLFTAMMLKSMREASLGGGLGDSQETQTYQEMYDQQLSLQMAHGKGLGLAEMLMQQLTRANAAHSTAAAPSSSAGANAAAPPATSAAGGDKISSAQRVNFVRTLEPLAQSAGNSLGVAPDTLIAQAALETGWGRNMPVDSNGRISSNLFGVKAGDSWRGAAVQATTTEYAQGTPSTTRAAFRSYGDAAQSVGDYVSLLRASPRYASALGAGSDVQAFGSGLQRGGYATDPDYVNKLVATVATLRQLRAAALKS
ncbi:MAG: flagellar assembly peptidoglycan hydrolase FlgJ [Steroidobacteraceae bacterium]|jgi:peptidoglycan hydrolase FlgJ